MELHSEVTFMEDVIYSSFHKHLHMYLFYILSDQLELFKCSFNIVITRQLLHGRRNYARSHYAERFL